MPIDIERFETDPEGDLSRTGSEPTNGERILTFLATNDEQAFTPSEIREATAVPRGSIGVVLSRLEDRGLVRHRGEYWAIGDAEEVSRELTTTRTARAASGRFGGEDPEEWGSGEEL